MNISLKRDSKLKHWGRLQYGLFLKGAVSTSTIMSTYCAYSSSLYTESFHVLTIFFKRTCPHTPFRTHIPTHPYALRHTRTLPPSHTHTHTPSLTHTHTHTLSLSLSHTHTHTFTPNHTLGSKCRRCSSILGAKIQQNNGPGRIPKEI